MQKNTCFVIMPIGDQSHDNIKISAADLKRRYDDLIREALLAAHPDLEVTRADEVHAPGTITTDILTRVMHSDFVVADVSFPNPNVFYELGLRHACRPGTVIIRDSKAPRAPFDIAHLRHITYENSATGLKALADAFRRYFEHVTLNPSRPDNHFLELAKLTAYEFPDYGPQEDDVAPQVDAMLAVMQSPDLLNLLVGAAQGKPVDKGEMIRALAAHPDVSKQLLGMFIRSGQIPFPPPPKKFTGQRRNKRGRKR